MNAVWSAHQVRRVVAGLGARVVASLEANVLSPISGRIGEELRVYWAQDDFAGIAALIGGSAEAYARADASLARAADIVIAANPHVAGEHEAKGARPRTIPFGCDADHFAAAADCAPARDVIRRRPLAVFMGHLGDRIDVTLLERLVHDGVGLLLVGPRHFRADFARFDALLAHPSVQWVGEQAFDSLPGYLACADVGLVPYNHSRFNIGSFPLKTLEYLAAGLPVVSTSLPGVEWIGSEDITFADDPQSFSSAVRSVASAGRSAATDRRRRELAARHSWDARARDFACVMGITQAARHDRGALRSPLGRVGEP
ncbi:glycosyltransferase [Sinomonas sp. ASV486]|uniref:glycosyltransferase n=1 Tax=Sinomonas sp. ASV486 TaxID=3051170 RepID=UPI0027DD7A28|nr:glycosyltransferase [Sinomonas sp. ASV486]MDQ4490351.1 glycosyltransferase [Sinomonas sp. ASV486]